MITVVEVFRLMNVEPDKDKTWAVGQIVQARWSAMNQGELPEKDLRPKTNGGGSHCFAVYPESFLPVIKDAIRSINALEASQMSLLGDE